MQDYTVNTIEFQSTSTMAGSGSAWASSATTEGVFRTDVSSNAPMLSPIRRSNENPFGEQTIEEVSNPLQPGTPIGDGTWILMLLAIGYALFIALMKKRERTGQ